MASRRIACGLLAAGLLIGCQSTSKQPPAPTVISAAAVRAIEQNYQRVNPNTHVGQVVEVHAEAQLAAIGDVAVNDFAENDVVVFIDAKGNVIANGRVRRIIADHLAVKYVADQPGQRAPHKGDLAVCVK